MLEHSRLSLMDVVRSLAVRRLGQRTGSQPKGRSVGCLLLQDVIRQWPVSTAVWKILWLFEAVKALYFCIVGCSYSIAYCTYAHLNRNSLAYDFPFFFFLSPTVLLDFLGVCMNGSESEAFRSLVKHG